jgi:hypothetical protein
MRHGEIEKMASGLTPDDAEPAQTEQAAASRALVALTPANAAHRASECYRQAPFLAHLLATKDQHPQTRERRRAGADEALAAYLTTAALTRFG